MAVKEIVKMVRKKAEEVEDVVADTAKSVTTTALATIQEDKQQAILKCARCHLQTTEDIAKCPKCGFVLHKVADTISQVIKK